LGTTHATCSRGSGTPTAGSSRPRRRSRIRASPGSWGASRGDAAPSGSLLERVSDPVDRPDEPGIVPVLAEFAPDARHLGIHHAPARVVAIAPDAIHQLVAAEHDAGLAREGEEDLELQRCEADLLVIDLDATPRRVDAQ